MRLPGRSTKASVALIPTVLALSLFLTSANADDPQVPNLSTATNQPAQTTTGSAQPANTDSAKPTTTTDTKNTNTKTTTSDSIIVISNTGSGATGSRSAPVITGPTTSADDRPTAVPKLPGGFSYPPASVPPTQDAPYMRVSNLPEGTVFIGVGAILGFFALLVLLWRALTVWSLHRSIRLAAARLENTEDTKALFRTPAPPTFKYSDRDSTPSLSNLVNPRGAKKNRPSIGHIPPSQGLFYSPTVAAANGLGHSGNRGSSYLPAGYYAAGASTPGNGAGMTHIGSRSQENINLTTLQPHSQGMSRGPGMGRTPPDSPSLTGNLLPTVGHRLNNSSSTINLDSRTRAPSAYLDDLFDEVGGAPGAGPSPSPLSHRHSSHGAPF